VPDDRPRSGTTDISVRANERGEFEFIGRPNGNYLLGVNLLSIPFPQRLSGIQPPTWPIYPPTYFPGTTNRAEAGRVVIGSGDGQSTLDIVLGEPVRRGRLKVHIAGAPPGAELSVCITASREDGSRLLGGVGKLLGPDEILDVIEGVSYRVHAHAIGMHDEYWESEFINVVATSGTMELTLRLTSRQPADEVHSSLRRFR
jgi:hypothetical protein